MLLTCSPKEAAIRNANFGMLLGAVVPDYHRSLDGIGIPATEQRNN